MTHNHANISHIQLHHSRLEVDSYANVSRNPPTRDMIKYPSPRCDNPTELRASRSILHPINVEVVGVWSRECVFGEKTCLESLLGHWPSCARFCFGSCYPIPTNVVILILVTHYRRGLMRRHRPCLQLDFSTGIENKLKSVRQSLRSTSSLRSWGLVAFHVSTRRFWPIATSP